MAESEPPPRPPSPRSPRPAAVPAPAAPPPGLPPGALVGLELGQPPHAQRPSLGSMLFLTAFFFFMSGNNNMPVQPIAIGPDGEIIPRVTELDFARERVDEWRGHMNGSEGLNWTAPAAPVIYPAHLVPGKYDHPAEAGPFFTNITGFYRDAAVQPLSLLGSHSSSTQDSHSFFHNLLHGVPNINTTAFNHTLAEELRGSYDWANVYQYEMNIRERPIDPPISSHLSRGNFTHWTWIKGNLKLLSRPGGGHPTIEAGEEVAMDMAIEYDFYGLHFVPNGTYNLFGMPEGKRVDIRNIPKLFGPETGQGPHARLAEEVVLQELEKELKVQESSLLLADLKEDIPTTSSCPLLMYLTLPPLPAGTSPFEVEQFDRELRDPTGIGISLARPPAYWQGTGLGGVIVADQCGWAFGVEKGKGVGVDDFRRKSVNYAAFATIAQLVILLLLVRQMEATRTPFTLSKVSFWTIIIMVISDSWLFNVHVVLGIMYENRASLPMLIPGFLCLCSAIVFGPRYAVLLHRIQAPERVSTPTVRPAATIPAAGTGGLAITPEGTGAPGQPTTIPPAEENGGGNLARLGQTIVQSPALRLAAAVVVFLLISQIAFLPPIIPFFLFTLYSFWVPQIYRNARRGTTGAFDKTFVIGTSAARLASPLYVFACPENIFFVKQSRWVWGLVLWQGVQIFFMALQERFGPAFFLPKSLAPAESYNYHPILPAPDAESGSSLETTCSICMEEVDTRPGPSGEVLLGMNPRRSYAVAPCHHLFHTKCLSQWLAIKTICPLCKRSLPPL